MKRIATRLAVMFAVAALAVFSLLGVSLYRVLNRELERHQKDEINTKMQVMEHMIGRCATLEKWTGVRTKLDLLSPGDGSTRFWVISGDSRYRYGEELHANVPDGLSKIDRKDQDPLRTLAKTVAANGDRPGVRLIVALDSTRFYDTLRVFALALLVSAIVGTALVAALGFWIANVGLGPLNRLSEEAHGISATNLSQRLRMSPLPAELSALTKAFNGALDRLEAAYKQLESFNADVAHELRTPLTNLIGQTQVALSKERTAAQHEEVLQSNLEELDRLRAIINDMLFLARADQGETASNRRRASLAGEVGKSVEFLELILEEAGVVVRVDGDAESPIETALFRRAVTNLLLNAVQHSEANAEIVVGVEEAEGCTRVAVSNPGRPIPEEHVDRLFDRFYRVDASRGNSGENHGLGLAIVKAIAKMHGGSVFVSNGEGRTTVGFTIVSA